MSQKKATKSGRDFAIELKARGYLKSVEVPSGPRGVLLEGTLGALKSADFVEDVVLEVTGEKGILRVDLSREDLKSAHGKREKSN